MLGHARGPWGWDNDFPIDVPVVNPGLHNGGRAIVKRTKEGMTPFEETTMRMCDVQGIEIRATRGRVFEFLRNPSNLPRWAHAFTSAEDGLARLETRAGAVDVRLGVSTLADTGTVDWRLTFPDGSVALAQSRVTETTRARASIPSSCTRRRWQSNRSTSSIISR
jgi:hypothetical protein